MAYVNNEKEPELLFTIDNPDDQIEVDRIKQMVENMNHDLQDSGFGIYQYVMEIVGNKVYIRRV